MPQLETNDHVRLYYEDVGSGPALVFVPGWTMTTRFWHEQVDALRDEFRCVTFDPRAYGRSEKTTRGHRIARHARDLFDVMTALDVEDCTLIGWSTGAAVCLCYTELFRFDHVARLVLVDQPPRNTNGDDWRCGFGSRAEAEEFIRTIKQDQPAAARGLVTSMFAEPPSDADLAWMLAESLKTPTPAAAELERDDFHQDWRDILSNITIPTIAVAGALSKVFPNDGIRYLASHIPTARLEIFERSGHCPFLEEPERFNTMLRAFALQSG